MILLEYKFCTPSTLNYLLINSLALLQFYYNTITLTIFFNNCIKIVFSVNFFLKNITLQILILRNNFFLIFCF